MTSPTYEIADFQELESVIRYPMKDFVDILNYVVDDEAQDELCDFYIVMKHLRKVNKTIFDYILNFFTNNENNTLCLYIFLKFLLLDEVEQIEFVNKYFHQNNLLIELHKKNLPIKDILKDVFEFVEDDYLNNFLDYRDNYSQYRPLNIKNLKNIDKANINYMNKKFIKRFVLNIRIILRCNFVYKLIYLISDMNKTQTLKEGESSITTYEDFIRRFEYNIDEFAIMYYYNYSHRYTMRVNSAVKQRIKEWIQQISGEVLLLNTEEKYDKIRNILYKMIDIDNSNYTSIQAFNGFHEICPYFIDNFLLIKYDYNLNTQDDYKLFSTITYNKIHSDILHKRYRMYFKSVLYRSLVLISDVYKSLYTHNIRRSTEINEYDRKVLDFEEYLEKILKTYHFERNFSY